MINPPAGPPRPPRPEPRLFSVGHSNHDLPRLVELLRGAGITAVADVRSQPYSRRLPQFNRAELEQGLKQGGIAYVFLGDVLGGRPSDPDVYDDEGRVDYERVRRTAAFRDGLDRLVRGLDRFTVAMLCSEDDPLDCHRGLMITPALRERGIAPLHLRKDGTVETTEALEARLLAETGTGAGILDGLFAPTLTAEEYREIKADAYRQMARRKAFRLRPETATGPEGGGGESKPK
jgi:hypothetical protein